MECFLMIVYELGLLLKMICVCFVVLAVFCYLSFGVMRLSLIIKGNMISKLFLISTSCLKFIRIVKRLSACPPRLNFIITWPRYSSLLVLFNIRQSSRFFESLILKIGQLIWIGLQIFSRKKWSDVQATSAAGAVAVSLIWHDSINYRSTFAFSSVDIGR
jgi:hypothetical protein